MIMYKAKKNDLTDPDVPKKSGRNPKQNCNYAVLYFNFILIILSILKWSNFFLRI